MEYSSCFDTNWNDLPYEIKVIIVRKLGNHCRLSLRSCSREDRQLVDSVKFLKLHIITITNAENDWSFNISRTRFSGENYRKFTSCVEFQEKLIEELDSVDYIRTMIVFQSKVDKGLMLSKNGERRKIRELQFPNNTFNLGNILEQVEPIHLKKLIIYSENLEPTVFDMPQVLYAESILGVNESLCDAQLETLNCEELNLETSNNVTSAGFNQFIQKCVLHLDERKVSFRIRYDEKTNQIGDIFKCFGIANSMKVMLKKSGTLLLNSPSSKFQLKVEYGHGLIYAKTIKKKGFDEKTVRLDFNSIRFMKIENNEANCELTIKENNTVSDSYTFDNAEELQTKLTEEIDGLNYIRELVLSNKSHVWKLENSGNKKITVGKLFIYGEKSIEVLKQIEPIHLKEITISANIDDERIYDMPQVIHAQKLFLSNSVIRNDQLLKLNAIRLDLQADISRNCTTLTESGINELLKKCIYVLNEYDFYIYISSLATPRDSFQLFEGLDISSQEQLFDGERVQVIVNSSFSAYQLKITRSCVNLQSLSSFDAITIERVERKNDI